MSFDIEVLAERVHEAYITTCNRLGWNMKPVDLVPYESLTEDSRELYRASVLAVLEALDYKRLASERNDWKLQYEVLSDAHVILKGDAKALRAERDELRKARGDTNE